MLFPADFNESSVEFCFARSGLWSFNAIIAVALA